MREKEPRIRLISEERIYNYKKENNYLGFITYMEITGWTLIKHKGQELTFKKYNRKLKTTGVSDTQNSNGVLVSAETRLINASQNNRVPLTKLESVKS